MTTSVRFLNIYKTEGGIWKPSTLYFSLSASRQSLGLKLCQQMEHSCVHTSVLSSVNWTCSYNYWEGETPMENWMISWVKLVFPLDCKTWLFDRACALEFIQVKASPGLWKPREPSWMMRKDLRVSNKRKSCHKCHPRVTHSSFASSPW